MSDEGIELVLTSVQFAAVLENETIEESSSLSNRLWGVATLAGGALELVGAAALILTPEPTTITKIAGGTLGVHGLDTSSAGLMQIVSGRTRTTLTSQAVASAAEALGADPKSAASVGMAVDIAVPLLAGFAGLLRALAIRRGAISLVAAEAEGGHTIARHIGLTEAQLNQRLTQQLKIPAASTFKTLKDAERFVGDAVRANKSSIKDWAKGALPGQNKAFIYNAGRPVGHGVVRGVGKIQDMSKLVIVVQKVKESNRVYFVLTAYPKP